MKESAIELLKGRMKSNDTLLCCGLDPDMTKIPLDPKFEGLPEEQKIELFLQQVIDVTAEHVCAYKIQKAFFDKFPNGHNALKNTIAYIHTHHQGIPAIIDCKIGDIDNTMQAYLSNLFDELGADGIVVNPYMGDDVMKPMANYPDKAIVVLAKTSNPGGGVVQDVELSNGQPLWQHILNLTFERWNSAGNMIPVVSSTVGLDMTAIRKMIPDQTPILLAGVGAQGGSFDDLAKLLNSQKMGVFVNSSRGIIYAQSQGDETWQEAIERSAIQLKNDLNKQRAK